jgi:hypothetical protein
MSPPVFWILATVEAVIWYLFIWYLLDTVKNVATRNLWIAAIVLLLLLYAGIASCPLVWQLDAWSDLLRTVAPEA